MLTALAYRPSQAHQTHGAARTNKECICTQVQHMSDVTITLSGFRVLTISPYGVSSWALLGWCAPPSSFPDEIYDLSIGRISWLAWLGICSLLSKEDHQVHSMVYAPPPPLPPPLPRRTGPRDAHSTDIKRTTFDDAGSGRDRDVKASVPHNPLPRC